MLYSYTFPVKQEVTETNGIRINLDLCHIPTNIPNLVFFSESEKIKKL